jgi:hypothetical protein
VRSQTRGRGIPSNACAIEDYEWDYGQVQSSALPRHQPSLDISQPLSNEYPDQNESNLNYTNAPPGTSTSIEDITQGIAQSTLGSSSSSIQQPTFKATWPTPSAPSNYITTRNPSVDRESFDPRKCQVAGLHFGGNALTFGRLQSPSSLGV